MPARTPDIAKPSVMLVADQLQHLHAGTEGQMQALCHGLLDTGWRVELAVLRNAQAIRERWPTRVHEIGVASMSDPRSWWRAARFAGETARRGFTLAHLFFNDAAILLPPLLAARGVRVVVSRRDMGFWYGRATLPALRLSRRFVSRVVANSHAVADHVAIREGYDRADITVIYNGVSVGRTDASRPTSEGEDLVIGLVANIRPVKRIQDAIAAFSHVAAKHPKVTLEIVGGGDPSDLVRQAKACGLEGRVRFTGQVADPRAWLPGYAIGLLTSESEGLSNSIIEYMLAGCPVVCTETGGNPELVSHGSTGLLYPVGDVESLADCLDRLVCDPSLRRQLGAAARREAESRFGLAPMIDAHDALYRSILSRDAVSQAHRAATTEGHR